uniref:(northern house mosquito) hypothetical protein n=1 Tax=Culex pipiens TaxID=7175 RepID=A0A8D8G0J6_CULPI
MVWRETRYFRSESFWVQSLCAHPEAQERKVRPKKPGVHYDWIRHKRLQALGSGQPKVVLSRDVIFKEDVFPAVENPCERGSELRVTSADRFVSEDRVTSADGFISDDCAEEVGGVTGVDGGPTAEEHGPGIGKRRSV